MNRRILSMVAFSTLFAAVVWVYGWLIYASLFTHPNAEDLSLSHPAFTVGRWTFIKHTLATYDGRYFINFMHTLTPLAFKWVEAYPLMAITGVILSALSLWWFLSSTLNMQGFRAFLIAPVTMAIHFATTPSLPHQLYWMSSSMVYLWCWIFFLLFAGTTFRLLQSRSLPAKFLYLLVCCLSMAACLGTNEMMLPVVTLFVSYLLITYHSHQLFTTLLFVTGLTIVFICFFIFSPGIGERLVQEELIKQKPEVNNTIPLGYYLNCYKQFSLTFINSPAIAGFTMILFAGNYEFKPIVSRWANTRLTVIFFTLAVITITLPYFIPFSNGIGYPERIFGCMNILVIIATLFLAIKLGCWVKQSVYMLPATSLILLSWLVIGNTNTALLVTEFKNGTLAEFHKAMQQRHETLITAGKRKMPYTTVAVHPIAAYPQTIYIPTDIQPDRKAAHWNQAYEMFYSIDRVTLSNDTVNYSRP